jgi:hypothetical protein
LGSFFLYLNENQTFFNNLEPDNVFALIKEGVPSRVYEIIDNK